MQPKERAHVNHGKRGRQKPPQGYDASSWDELIYASAVYDHDDQIVSYFNRMKEADQKRFLLEALSEGCDPCHHKAAQVIIKNL